MVAFGCRESIDFTAVIFNCYWCFRFLFSFLLLRRRIDALLSVPSDISFHMYFVCGFNYHLDG